MLGFYECTTMSILNHFKWEKLCYLPIPHLEKALVSITMLLGFLAVLGIQKLSDKDHKGSGVSRYFKIDSDLS